MKDCNEKGPCIGRREFLVKAGLVAGGVVLTVSSVGPARAAAFEDVTVEIAEGSSLAKVGGSQIVDSTAGKIIIIHAEADKYLAFSARCTHKGALLEYDPNGKKLSCNKHGSAFDSATGKVVHGPADEPVKAYSTTASEKKVVVNISN